MDETGIVHENSSVVESNNKNPNSNANISDVCCVFFVIH